MTYYASRYYEKEKIKQWASRDQNLMVYDTTPKRVRIFFGFFSLSVFLFQVFNEELVPYLKDQAVGED